MTTAELRQFAKDTLDGLPPEQLKVAAEFLRYLDERQRRSDRRAAQNPRVVGRLAEAERDIAEGKTVNWRELRRDV